MNIYEITVKNQMGKDVSMSDFKGKVLLIVNTATGCGFTPQYEDLQALYEKYRDNDFEILDFPCNQFADQAPGTNEEIHSFCTMRYGITFPQFAKIDVNGTDESPLYTYLKKEKGGILGSNIKWNFTKFLVDKEGNIVGRYGSIDKPRNLENAITALL